MTFIGGRDLVGGLSSGLGWREVRMSSDESVAGQSAEAALCILRVSTAGICMYGGLVDLIAIYFGTLRHHRDVNRRMGMDLGTSISGIVMPRSKGQLQGLFHSVLIFGRWQASCIIRSQQRMKMVVPMRSSALSVWSDN